MSPSEIDHQYIPTNPLYLPRYWPEWPFRLGEDILRTGAGTQYIGITAWDPTLAYIAVHQYTTLSHSSVNPHNPSHQMMSLIQRHVMSWWDAWGLEEQCGCCGRKSQVKSNAQPPDLECQNSQILVSLLYHHCLHHQLPGPVITWENPYQVWTLHQCILGICLSVCWVLGFRKEKSALNNRVTSTTRYKYWHSGLLMC